MARKPRPGARTERHLTAPRTLYLIDGDAYIHRAFHALPPLTNSRGEPVGAIYGFARMLQKILRQGNPDYVAVCFDTAAPTFRHKAFDQYKAHRKELDDALKHQLPLAKELARAWGLPVVAMEGYEADDLIATLAHKAARKGVKVVVVTGDKDAMQLVGRNIAVLAEPQGVRYEESDVEKKYGLRPDQMVDFFALTGDASDNVPGVPGIGPKTAAQLLQKYGTLDAALSRTREMKDSLKDKLEAHREDALMSRSLVALDLKAPVAVDPEACVRKAPGEELLELFKRYEFKGLLEEAAAQAPGKRGKVEVTTVLTAAALEKLAKEARSAEALAVNVRTAGPALVGLAIAAKPGAAWYVPVGHGYLGHPAQLSAAAVLKALAPALEDEALPKASQNLKSDILALKRQGVDLRGGEFDVLVASYCLNPARAAFDLNELALDLLGEGMTSLEEVVGKGAKQVTFDQVEIKAAAEYAGAGAEASLRLREKMTPLLREKGVDKLYRDVELPLIGLLAEMERLGVRLDVKYLKDLEGSFAEEIAAVEKAVHGLAGYTFNIGSPKQLAELLFEKLKLPVIRRTKTGFSTDEEVLQKLSALHPLPAKVLEYRELSKLKSTYIDALLALADERGRVHTSLNQAVTATGRLSSTEPNLQNIPIRTEHGRLIRKAFTTEKGWVLVSADYSQIDLRVLAHVSRDPVLCESFRNGEDVHAAAAREIFGLAKGEAPTADQRRVAKSVNFGLAYGQTSFGLSQTLGVPVAEAQRYIDRYFARYAGVQKWIKAVLEQARKDGYVTTLLHRIRYLPEIHSPNAGIRQFAERTAMNTPIQGTSADIIKVAMRDVARGLKERASKARMLLQVHDELLFEMPAAEAAETSAFVRRKMEEAVKLEIPLVVDLKQGVNWTEMEKIVAS